ncbi:tRNA lysidine(34) synthetase TilS [Chromobacterium sp. IIBBL 290-4]|uniref:tRNA lysidine(34) synthetase TilS n=1 Tax=Chromobacterium sp. IIBBL 290-4 TaxID=2953890 RepID=UPI0020B75494|nr:tRNA lysidine(34) synthetase TilS [Chromobacterium sp. IIBBL 290-4]UTH74404.1 tRNA lysidine(34) synthetase TilS [Chromobacterium sp. IIBBL 290-4]
MAASRKTQPDLLKPLLEHWPDELSGQCAFEVGLSGGLDSVALLSLLARARDVRPDLAVAAVHVHHGLSPNADAWAAHCQALCRDLNVPLRIARVTVRAARGEGVEAAAREARYQAYREGAAQVVALAHHQDDQAETVLLQLLRGGGVKALAAMPALRPLSVDKLLWRPLLDFTRAQLERYVQWQGLAWVEDESNRDNRYRRNLLRNDIFPVLAASLPHYRSHLARAASLQADAAAILDEVAAMDIHACAHPQGLDLARWLGLSSSRQRQALLGWLERQGMPLPEPAGLLEFQRQLTQARVETCPLLPLAGGLLFRFGGAIQLLLESTPPAEGSLLPDLSGGKACDLPEWGGELSWEWRERGLPEMALASGLRLMPRAGGEKLPAKAGRREVKDLMREAGLPPPLRQRWPLLYGADGALLAVPGIAVSHAAASQPGWWPLWRPWPLRK